MKYLSIFLLLASLTTHASVPEVIRGVDLVSHEAVELPVTRAVEKTHKASVIVFLSAKCPCSNSHESKLEAIRKEFQSQGFSFLGVHSNQDEPLSLALEHFKASPLTLPIIRDDNAALANQLGALKTPHVFVIAPSRKILYQGGIDDSHISADAKAQYLEAALRSILVGKEPAQAQTRTLGCMISRKK